MPQIGKPEEKDAFSEFFSDTPVREQKKVINKVIRDATRDQRKIMS